MKLDSIRLQNYRCHEDLTVNFKSGLNAVAGVNGSGKTALLRGICEAFDGFIIGMRGQHSSPLSEPGHVRLLARNRAGRVRSEPQYPVVVAAEGLAFSVRCACQLTKRGLLENTHLSGQYPGQIWQEIHPTGYVNADANSAVPQAIHSLPLLAFYRANRHWELPAPPAAQWAPSAMPAPQRADGYASWWDASQDAPALQDWVIAKCWARAQTAPEAEVMCHETDDELALVNTALGVAIEGVKGLRYDFKQHCLWVDWQVGAGRPPEATAFEHLSDGQRGAIGLVADMARRMCLLNPQLGQAVTRQTPGVVLIDVLEMHLHPQWQRRLTLGLQAAFPALQLIVASHSPQILGELHPDQMILLRPEGSPQAQVRYGLDANAVLKEIMQAPALHRCQSVLAI